MGDGRYGAKVPPQTPERTPQWLAGAVSAFGTDARDKLAGPGQPEANIRTPLETLLRAVGAHLGRNVVFFDEVRDAERRVRPDYAFNVDAVLTGYVEVKAPDVSIDPATFTGHDLEQWERQRDLPNLIYTNGTDFRLYRDGEPVGEPVRLDGDLRTAGPDLSAPPALEAMLRDAFDWAPAPITNVNALVRAVAPLTRLLRGEVVDQLEAERRATASSQPFTGLAADWRGLLFPHATDQQFADGYAQAVTFALLLARTRGIDLAGQPLHEVGNALGATHSLMGRALQLLTDAVAADFKVTLDLLVRVIGAVRWDRIRTNRRDPYLYLYEDFLDEYDPKLRQSSGSYYTPHEVVEPMVRLVGDVLRTRLGKDAGYADPNVFIVDPAMGTGAYLQQVLASVAQDVEEQEGPGAVPGRLTEAAARVVGFEIQMGPYAVAQLRAGDLLAGAGATAPPGGMRLYVTDTLDDPHAPVQQLASTLAPISQSRADASEVKASQDVTVVIGNPPWDENAAGRGGWVENGSAAHGRNARAIMADFRSAGDGVNAQNLKHMHVFFWRWATWKVWESTPPPATDEGDAGVVCFISTSAYGTGPAFRGMRQYLRRWASEGWFIDLSPEGQQPAVNTRVFPGVQQRIAIGLFVRRPGTSRDEPADIRTISLSGTQSTKFAALDALGLDDAHWLATRTGWTERFTPAAEGAWDQWPAMDDLMPWTSPGVTLNRAWPYSPSEQALKDRWSTVVSENDPRRKRELFKESRDARVDRAKDSLPGIDTYRYRGAFQSERGDCPRPVRAGYRAFDRHWVIPDARLMHAGRPALWAARRPGQVFVVELHSTEFKSGPALVFSALIPDMHHFKGSEGGRVLPLLHADGSANLPPGLTAALGSVLGTTVTPQDLLSYIAAITGHPAYRETFVDELRDPGVRIPLTSDPDLWRRGIELGDQVLLAHTFGGDGQGTDVAFPTGDPRRVRSLTPVTSMPASITYDPDTQTIELGGGTFGPVSQAVRDYTVGGRNVLDGWVSFRRAEPAGRRSSPLDDINPISWEPAWTTDLLQVLSVLTRLVELEGDQEVLLADVLAGDVLTRDELASAGVRWPARPADRKPRRALTLAIDADGTRA